MSFPINTNIRETKIINLHSYNDRNELTISNRKFVHWLAIVDAITWPRVSRILNFKEVRLATHHVSHTKNYIYFRLLGITAFPTCDSWLYVSLGSDAAWSVPNSMIEPQPYTVPSSPRYEAYAKTSSDSPTWHTYTYRASRLKRSRYNSTLTNT